MADDQNKAQENPVTDTPASPMPSEDQKTTEVVDATQTQEQSPDVEREAKPTEELSESAPERTRREFEKLKTKLREEREERQRIESLYRSFAPTKKVEEKPVELSPIYDPNTGLLDEQALGERDKRLLEAEERAKRAEQAAKQAIDSHNQRLLEQEETEMFAGFPELDPESTKFDKTLHRLTRSIKLDSMLNPQDYEGKQLSGSEAAKLAKEQLKDMKVVKAEGAQEAIEQLTPKEQAALEATGTPARRSQTTSIDDLRRRSRKGDYDAIVERLKGLEG